jgi:hypothetical protein
MDRERNDGGIESVTIVTFMGDLRLVIAALIVI